MNENYKCLGNFNFGKRNYVILKNENKIKYFEKINEQYVMPILGFSLYDNEGKSLTHVNQHYFMNELTKKINEAFNKKIFVNDIECINYLDNLIKEISSDIELKRLFKGTNMKIINEEYFERNKKDINKYLDKFRCDTFVNYNNVSIFDGSILKNENKILENSELNEEIKEEKIDEINIEDKLDNLEVVDFSEIKEDKLDNLEIIESNEENIDEFEIIDFNQIKEEKIDEFELSEDEKIKENKIENLEIIDSNQINEDNKIKNNDEFLINELEKSNNVIDLISDFEEKNINYQFNNLENNDNSNIEVKYEDNINNEEIKNENINEIKKEENLDFINNGNLLFNNSVNENNINNNKINENINTELNKKENINLSYIDQVKNRIENNKNESVLNVKNSTNINFGEETDINSEVIVDNNQLPEIDNINNEIIKEYKTTKKKKGKFKFIILFILLNIIIGGVLIYIFVL